jgi:hypothetical protein
MTHQHNKWPPATPLFTYWLSPGSTAASPESSTPHLPAADIHTRPRAKLQLALVTSPPAAVLNISMPHAARSQTPPLAADNLCTRALHRAPAWHNAPPANGHDGEFKAGLSPQCGSISGCAPA